MVRLKKRKEMTVITLAGGPIRREDIPTKKRPYPASGVAARCAPHPGWASTHNRLLNRTGKCCTIFLGGGGYIFYH